MDDDEIGAELDRTADQFGRRRHASDDAVDLEGSLDLQAIRRVVLESLDLECLVEVANHLA